MAVFTRWDRVTGDVKLSAKLLSRLALAGLIAGAASASAATPEALGYQVVYRGMFSLGREMPIADIRLAKESFTGKGTASQTTMTASSVAYDQVESLYPIRYRFRSWADGESGQLIGLEAYEKTHREKHRMYLRDDSAAGMRRVDPSAAADSEQLAGLLAAESPAIADARPLFDRLGLLNQIRQQKLSVGAAFDFPVTNGRDRMHYRVHVQKAAKLSLGNLELPSWKLRLDAMENDEHGEEVAAHRPVYIWLSRDARRLPLRVEVRHAVGLFRVQLSSPPRQTVMLAAQP